MLKSLFRTISHGLLPILGVLLLFCYWYSIRPISGGRFYSEDLCYSDLTRQFIANQIKLFGKPHFQTDQFMTPQGASIPFMSWNIERDWIGAYFWIWNPDFPFLWVMVGVSLLVTFFVTGFFIKRLGMERPWIWAMTTLVVLFHIPRHYKIWHHYEHIIQHWLYASLFLDAWIWQRYVKGKKISLLLECWRIFILVGMMGTVGIFWGPLILEWLLVRFLMLMFYFRIKPDLEISQKQWIRAILPVSLASTVLMIQWKWFMPLRDEVLKLGAISQPVGWFAHLGYVVRPLFLEVFKNRLGFPPLDSPETVVSVGWTLWIPVIAGVYLTLKKNGINGLLLPLPFIMLLLIGCIYFGTGTENVLVTVLQFLIPFMEYFRVASRWGLFFPPLLCIILIFIWPELRSYFNSSKFKWVITGAAITLFVAESHHLLLPVNAMAPFPQNAKKLLEEIRDEGGSTVLSLPFCVAGGNGVCTESQCPNHPYSTTAQCLRLWHGKKVYGLYQSRMTQSHCRIYDKKPFVSWFEVWKAQRCFTEVEWREFCEYLKLEPSLSALLVFPDIWYGARESGCVKLFDHYLGKPFKEASYFLNPSRGGKEVNPTRMLWYRPKCNVK